MSVEYKELEHNEVELTVEIPLEDIKKAEDTVYNKQKSKIQLPGFRKGKAPKELIKKTFGKGIFLEDAVNEILPYAYEEAVNEVEKEQGIKIVSYPEMDFKQVEVDKPVIFVAKAAKKPTVELGEYKGLKVESKQVRVTEKDITEAINKEAEKSATIVPVTDRAVADGDMVTLDFLGKVDGEAFEGGEGKDYPLTIGSHTFIEGFEEQLVGMNIDETKDVNVTFPEKYQEPTLAGKPAVFTCTIKSIKVKELPELNDEFASEVSEFETFEEYKADVKKKLSEEKKAEAKKEKEDALVELAVSNAKMDISELQIKSEARAAVDNFAQRLSQQGLSIDQYMQYTGQSEKDLIEQQMEPAKKQISYRLLLEAVAEAEKLEVTDADVDAEFERMANSYGIEVEKLRSFSNDEQIAEMKKDLATSKAVDFIFENAAK